jgi:hypothetical protein
MLNGGGGRKYLTSRDGARDPPTRNVWGAAAMPEPAQGVGGFVIRHWSFRPQAVCPILGLQNCPVSW